MVRIAVVFAKPYSTQIWRVSIMGRRFWFPWLHWSGPGMLTSESVRGFKWTNPFFFAAVLWVVVFLRRWDIRSIWRRKGVVCFSARDCLVVRSLHCDCMGQSQIHAALWHSKWQSSKSCCLAFPFLGVCLGNGWLWLNARKKSGCLKHAVFTWCNGSEVPTSTIWCHSGGKRFARNVGFQLLTFQLFF